MSTLKTNNIEHLDASTPSIQTTIGGGTILTGLSTATNGLNVTGGSVGIGTDNPAATLHVRGSSSPRIENTGTISLIRFQNSNAQNVFYGSDTDKAVIYTQSTERLRIDSSGRVLINQTSVGAKSASAPLQLISSSTGAFGLNISMRSNNDYGFISYTDHDADEDIAQIGVQRTAANTGDLIFYTNGGNASATEEARILSTGGITFNGDTATANALDDYEEGTWTPELADAATGGNVATATINGRYMKIGSQVTISMDITNINTSGLTGGNAIFIRNLPYTIQNYNGTIRYTGASAHSGITLSNDYTTIVLLVQDNNAYARLLKTSTNSSDAASNVTVSQLASGSADIRGSVVYSIA